MIGLTGLLFVAAWGGSSKGEAASAELSQYANGLYTEARSSKNPNYKEVQAKIKAKAEELLAGVDPKKLDASEGLDWAGVFFTAQRYKDETMLLERFVATKPDAEKAYTARMNETGAFLAMEDPESAGKAALAAKPTDANEAARLAGYEAEIAGTLGGVKGDKAGEKYLQKAERSFPYELIKANPKVAGRVKASFAIQESQFAIDRNDSAAAKKIVADALVDLDPKSPEYRELSSTKGQLDIMGSPAPELTFTEKYGEYANLAALKGKVVILDFFAHWCGPCKASMPDMHKLTDDLSSKGLSVIGVTAYYGFFGDAATKIDKPTEFKDMEGFLSQYQIDHPVIFVDRSEFKKYSVPGIPQFVLIDKKGNVRKIQVGYDASSFAAFRKQVEAAVNE